MSLGETSSSTHDDFSRDSLSTWTDNHSSGVSLAIAEGPMERPTPKIILDEVFLEPYPISRKKAFPITKFGDASAKLPVDAERATEEPFVVENIRQSGLWPALTALETSLHASDVAHPSDDADDVLKKLNDDFTTSPRRFAESLVTIIEESFVQPDEERCDDSVIGLMDLLKKTVNAGKRLDDESAPVGMYSRTGSDTKSSPLGLDRGRLLEDDENGSMEPFIYLLSESRGHAEFTNAHTSSYLRLVSPSRFADLEKMSKDPKKYAKTPRITVQPPSPMNAARRSVGHRRNRTPAKKVRRSPVSPAKRNAVRFLSPVSDGADEYVTAESDTDEASELSGLSDTTRIERSAKGQLDMSKLASHHRDWVTTYDRISRQKSRACNASSTTGERAARSETDDTSELSELLEATRIERSAEKQRKFSKLASYHRDRVSPYGQISRHKSRACNASSGTGERTRRVSTHTKRLEMRIMKELVQKRQKCFDTVDRLRHRNASDTVEPEIGYPCSTAPCEISHDFCRLLSVCHEYFQCAMNACDIAKRQKNDNRRLAASSRTISETAKCNSPRSARKPIGKRRSLSSKSPRARAARISPKSPRETYVDTSSIRPVTQLRRVFSPRPPRPETAGTFIFVILFS